MCIKVWPFSEAPDTYRLMSTNGGDEDWVALVPLEWKDRYYIGWLEEGMSLMMDGLLLEHIHSES